MPRERVNDILTDTYSRAHDRIRKLEAALRALVEAEPVFRNHHGDWACLRCELLLPITSGDPVGFRHAPNCPVTGARTLLALPEAP